MPYNLEKSGNGFFVVTTSTGRRHSEAPLSRAKAVAQMKALYANVPDAKLKKKKKT